MRIQINRGASNLRYERRVSVLFKGRPGKSAFGINPQEELLQATGWNYSRQSCVVSFADGLEASGHTVFIKRPFVKEQRHETVPPYGIVGEYYLLGLVIGNRGAMPSLERWQRIVRMFRAVPYERRPEKLRDMSEYHLEFPHKDIQVSLSYFL